MVGWKGGMPDHGSQALKRASEQSESSGVISLGLVRPAFFQVLNVILKDDGCSVCSLEGDHAVEDGIGSG